MRKLTPPMASANIGAVWNSPFMAGMFRNAILRQKPKTLAATSCGMTMKKLKDSHINAHRFGGNAVRYDRVGQRQNGGPGKADAQHRNQEPIGIVDKEEREQPGPAQPDIDEMRPAQARAACDRGHHRRGERREAIIGSEEDSDPVGTPIVSGRLRIDGTEKNLRHGGRGVDPHREQGEPRKELYRSQPLHGVGHRLDVDHQRAENPLGSPLAWNSRAKPHTSAPPPTR